MILIGWYLDFLSKYIQKNFKDRKLTKWNSSLDQEYGYKGFSIGFSILFLGGGDNWIKKKYNYLTE